MVNAHSVRRPARHTEWFVSSGKISAIFILKEARPTRCLSNSLAQESVLIKLFKL